MPIVSHQTLSVSQQADGRRYCVFEYTFHTGEKQIQRARIAAEADHNIVRESFVPWIEERRAEAELEDLT